MMNKNIKNRAYSISKKKGELFTVSVCDSYSTSHLNYFDTEEEAMKWVYYIWENEEVSQQDKMKSLENAILGCIKLDEELGLIKGNRDNLD